MKNSIYLFSTSSHPDTIHINSLQITFFKPEIEFEKYDYLIITSKQISIFLAQYDFNLYKPLKALCVSKKSARAYEKVGGEVLQTGFGYGDNLSEIIKSYPKTTKWLYLRAEIVASSFANDCRKDGHDIEEIVAYKSGCSDAILDVKVEDSATLIFTSPSSVECFLSGHQLKPTHKVVAIGKTTAAVLPKEIFYYISEETSVESCVKLALGV